ncbi:uncharacterized protein LOC143917579 [Arctopsyche grandis]|uniref:uncharacterized protein LOC143917579 n=1 Tax=Arctopsyche grandis TaxID=121162 RepID=UPI00406D9B7D
MNGHINRSIGTSAVCYFCNETIGNQKLLQNHIIQCGSYLDKCEYCGDWVERKGKASHELRCPKDNSIRKLTMNTLPSRAALGAQLQSTLEDKMKEAQYQSTIENIDYIKRELATMRIVLQEERDKNEQLKYEIDQMRKQYNLSEERNKIVVATMTAMRQTNEEELTNQKLLLSDLNEEINNINMKNQECNNYVIKMDLQLTNLKQIIEHEQNERAQLELVLNNQDGKLRNFSKIEADLEDLKNKKTYETSSMNEQIFTIQRELNELKNLYTQENQTAKKQLQNIQSLHSEIDKNVKSSSELISKLEIIDFEMKSLKIIIEEHSSAIGATETNTNAISEAVSRLQISNEMSEVKQDISKVEVKQDINKAEEKQDIHKAEVKQDIYKAPSEIADVSGHLIWRIDNYQQKFKDSVENKSVLTSRKFLSHKYGYTLQADVNLNGIGKWKGRHLTISVYIIPGEFDPILEWPASMQVDIILKDQTPKRKQSMDIIKMLEIKSNDSEESVSKMSNGSNLNSSDIRKQYIFIPRASLDKLDYTKNDAIFLEFIVKN